MSEKLSEFEELFCREWVKDLNGTQAYMRARGPSVKARSAQTEASKLLSKPIIVARIRTLMSVRLKRLDISADRVLSELARVAFADMDDYAEVKDGKLYLVDSKDRKRGRSRVIKKISQSESSSSGETNSDSMSQSLELHDKLKALELLGKYLKLFTDKVEHSGTVTLADLVAGEPEAPK